MSDLPSLIHSPLAVFRSATHIGSFVVVTEIEHEGKNFVVAIEANKQKGRIEVNSIRSIHYRTSNSHIANWINEGLLEYADTKKMLDWLSKQRYNSADVRNTIKHATNIIKRFDNSNESGEKVRFREGNSESIDKVNERFNAQLEELSGTNADNVIFNLGNPSDALLSAGVENKPMKLYGNKVIKKMKKHGFALSELRDLPRAVSDPIAVFNNIGREGNRSILTELKTEQGNFLVTIDLGKGVEDIDFNLVSSVFGKSNNKILSWINRDQVQNQGE